VRVSKRAAGAFLLFCAAVLGLFAYGGYKRQQRQAAAFAEGSTLRNVAPATAAGADIAKDVPTGNLQTAGTSGSQGARSNSELLPPEDYPAKAGATDRVLVRQPRPVTPSATGQTVQPAREPSAEDRRLALAYQREQEAIAAPTTIRDRFGPQGTAASAVASGSAPVNTDGAVQLGSLIRSLASNGVNTNDGPRSGSSDVASYNDQNMQVGKESFIAKTRAAPTADYLKSVRTAPMSVHEIKAGWEIPAVLEQALNSDLPGELKALVTSNVYDTATGRFLLIPHGSRLVGVYDSRIGYGQDGAQVIWDRVIFPDASSLDLGGMIGQDAYGYSGFREKVDHHYRRLIGFAVLTSLFAAASDIAQSRNRTLLTYPSPGEVAASAAGREASDVGAQITRRNLNVQPTIKIPVGYKFNVRVNRDILFEAPYTPIQTPPR
jgi:type IV secretion system protein VirB10